jgi:hypothetical protein
MDSKGPIDALFDIVLTEELGPFRENMEWIYRAQDGNQ